MKISGATLFTASMAAMSGAAFAKDSQADQSSLSKYILSFKDSGTPQAIVDSAEKKLKELGALITYEYTLIKGFAFSASSADVKEFKSEEKTMNEQYPFQIEDDEQVSINNDKEIGKDTPV